MQTTYLWLIPLILLAAGAVIGVLLVLLTRRPTPETEAEYRVEYDTPDYTDEEYEMVTNYEIDGIPVTQYQSPGRLGMSTWTKEGFDYAVTAENPEMNLLNGVTYDFVMNTDAESSPDRD